MAHTKDSVGAHIVCFLHIRQNEDLGSMGVSVAPSYHLCHLWGEGHKSVNGISLEKGHRGTDKKMQFLPR